MKSLIRVQRAALVLGLVLLSATAPGCLVARVVKLDVQWDIPNTITDKGFRYVKKGVEVRYRVNGLMPAKLNRSQLMEKMSVAHSAYYRFWKKAGGLKDNQRLVNAVVEASFVRITGMSGSLFLVVHMYADVVELDAAPAVPAAPAAPPPSGGVGDPSNHPSTAPMVRRIVASLLHAATRVPNS